MPGCPPGRAGHLCPACGQGLLTELPNQHGDTMAQAVPGTSAQRVQEFLTKRPWDEEDLAGSGCSR